MGINGAASEWREDLSAKNFFHMYLQPGYYAQPVSKVMQFMALGTLTGQNAWEYDLASGFCTVAGAPS